MSDNQTMKKGAAHLSDADFDETVNGAGTPVMVDFYAEWCGPCKMAAPVIDKLADEFQGKVKIVKVDVDENPEVTKKFGVMSIPTVIVLHTSGGQKGGVKEIDRKIGFPGEQGYRQMIAKAGVK
jgi:thioredoxin 1